MNGREGSTPTPARLWFALLRHLGRGITGRRVATSEGTGTVVALHGRPDTGGWSLRRARDVRVVLRDVTTPDLTARELVVECDTLVIGSTVTATGVRVTATMTPESARALEPDDAADRGVAIVDGEVRSRWLPGVDMVVRPQVAADRLRFVPIAVITPVGRWSSPVWLPAVTAPPPELPGGLRLDHIATTEDAFVFRTSVERWDAPLRDLPALRELAAV
jgi:hypothetical protein